MIPSQLSRRMAVIEAEMRALRTVVGHPDPEADAEKRDVLARLRALEIAAKIAHIAHVDRDGDTEGDHR